jgi:hypothetical protein
MKKIITFIIIIILVGLNTSSVKNIYADIYIHPLSDCSTFSGETKTNCEIYNALVNQVDVMPYDRDTYDGTLPYVDFIDTANDVRIRIQPNGSMQAINDNAYRQGNEDLSPANNATKPHLSYDPTRRQVLVSYEDGQGRISASRTVNLARYQPPTYEDQLRGRIPPHSTVTNFSLQVNNTTLANNTNSTNNSNTSAVGGLRYVPLEGEAFKMFEGRENTDGNLIKFLQQAFQFGLAIAAALAVIMIVYGGVEIMLSESVFKKEDGRKKIKEAIYGLLLALVSWLILYIINPEILNFKI